MSYDYQQQIKTLNILEECLRQKNFLSKCHMGFGLFLGAIRQKKLNTSLNNWDDLDFNIKKEDWDDFIKNILPLLKSKGFKVLHRFETIFGEIGEITLLKNNDRIDFHQNFPTIINSEEKYFHYAWYGGIELGKAMKNTYFLNIKEYDIENVKLYGPCEAEEYLKDLYGDNWRIPCKSEDEYKFWEDYPGIPWTTKNYNEKIIKGDF